MPSIHPLMTLFVLAIPIACIAWTVTHEEVFREPRDWCQAKCQNCPSIYQRKFFYLFTCEYCFSHYVTLGFLFITRYRLLYDDWGGYVIRLLAGVGGQRVHVRLWQVAARHQA